MKIFCLSILVSSLILISTVHRTAGAKTSFGNPTVPSSGGSAGCWIQIIQQPVTQNSICIHSLALHLNQGTNSNPPNAFEIRVYDVNISSNIATLKRQRDITVDVANQDEQVIKLDSCLMAYKGEYVGIANPQGAMRDVVKSGGTPSWKYWNKFEGTSKVIGSTFVADNEFGPGSLGWRIDANYSTTVTTTKAPLVTTTSSRNTIQTTTRSGSSAIEAVVFGNPTVPSSGGSAGCWIQIIQQPVTQNSICIHSLALHLNQGTNSNPPNAFEIRVYDVNISSNIATLKRQRDITVDVANQDEQVIKLDSCLMAYKGEYVGIANPQGAMRDVVKSGGTPSWKYWNKFEGTSKVIGSTFVADNEFGPGSLGWRIDGWSNTNTIPSLITTTQGFDLNSVATTTGTGVGISNLVTTTLITGIVTAINLSPDSIQTTTTTASFSSTLSSTGAKLIYHGGSSYSCLMILFVICLTF